MVIFTIENASLLHGWKEFRKSLAVKHESVLIKLDNKLRTKLDNTLKQEEMLWFQQSREELIKLRDRNTKFYHVATRIKKIRNNSILIVFDEGERVQDKNTAKNMVISYFSAIFTHENNDSMQEVRPSRFLVLFEQECNELYRTFTANDIKCAMHDMSPFKAPGPKGFHARFYQKQWHNVGDTVRKQALDFFED